MSKRVTACRSCGTPIVWIRTKAGKQMPCDVPPWPYREKRGGDDKIVTEDGDVVCCEIITDRTELQDPEARTGMGYVPHWSTCNAPEKFRKRRK